VEAFEVEIEVNAGVGGDPRMVLVGLPDTAVKESRDRVTTAISNSGFTWPKCRTTINLAPADVKKEGPSFDLPIALGLVALGERGLLDRMQDCCAVGELALTGEVRPVKGVLPVALEARRRGRELLVVPRANVREASMVEGIAVYGVRTLREAAEFLGGRCALEPLREDPDRFLESQSKADCDFAEVRGQHQVRRAVEVAVSGGHNLLLLGAPGSGKSMIARRIPTIIPPMSLEEAIETTKIHSICGLLNESEQAFVATRPFRAPHHTVSDAGLLGGSSTPSPGEVSLAHNGVLFLDELPEFRRSTLEVLRQPLEDGRVTITRAAGTMCFPAEFMLVAAMNPCPCGNYGSSQRECRCSVQQVTRYRDKISGPLLDRIDLHLEVPAVPYREMSSAESGEDSAGTGAFGAGSAVGAVSRRTPGALQCTDEPAVVAETLRDGFRRPGTAGGRHEPDPVQRPGARQNREGRAHHSGSGRDRADRDRACGRGSPVQEPRPPDLGVTLTEAPLGRVVWLGLAQLRASRRVRRQQAQ
jgi:magnesium chelatase family protein